MYEFEKRMVERRWEFNQRFKRQVQKDTCNLCFLTGLTIGLTSYTGTINLWGLLGLIALFAITIRFSKYLVNL